MPRKILIVDDDRSYKALVVRRLGRMGHATLQASTAETALDAIHAEEPDAVVARVELPQMNGIELTIRLKQNPKTAYLPVILYSPSADRGAALRAGAAELISNPASFDDLKQAVESALKRKP